jgi:arylsulfatase A-like enzyme
MAEQNRHAIVDVFVIATWFGIVAGLLEGLVFTFIRLSGLMTWNMRQASVSFDFLWIAPLVNLAVFLGLACGLAAAVALLKTTLKWRGFVQQEAAVVFFAGLACYVALRVPDRLYLSAAIALSIGFALRMRAWFHAAVAAHIRWYRRTLVWLAVLLAVTATVTHGGAALIEGKRLRALPPAPTDAPNVLLLVLDTVRADHLSVYGYDRATTPNLERIAREGVLFEQAISPSSWTLPSHSSLFTGRFAHEHRAIYANPQLGPEFATLAEVLAARGFATGGFVANTEWLASGAGLARGFLRYEDYFHDPSDAFARTVLGREGIARLVRYFGERKLFGRKRASDVNGEFTHWLDTVGTRPFFAFLNYMDAHEPYASPGPYHTRFMTEGQKAIEHRSAFRPPPIAMWAGKREPSLFMAAYDGALVYLDAEIGKLIEELRKRGQLDKTIIVITADHGEAFADHGLFMHGHSLYNDQIHVPLIMRFPGNIPQARRVTRPVSTANVAATILSLARQAAGAPLPGSSLARFWEQPALDDGQPILSEVFHNPLPAVWPTSRGWIRSLVSGDWKYIEHQDGQIELYRADDPGETRDLAGTPNGLSVVGALRPRLAEMITKRR